MMLDLSENARHLVCMALLSHITVQGKAQERVKYRGTAWQGHAAIMLQCQELLNTVGAPLASRMEGN